MSRCFPFPPPGYENKARLNDLSLIIKEKHKHKDKRHKDNDREKKEKNEQKGKDRADGKHKEKKGHKRKHKDKKKEKQTSSEEEKTVGPSGNQNGHSHRILVEMGERVRNDDMAMDSSCATISLEFVVERPGNNWVGYFSAEKRIKAENGYCVGKVVEQRNGSEKKNGDGLDNGNRDKHRKEDKKRKKEQKEEKVKETSSKDTIERNASDGNLQDFCAQKPKDLLKESWDRQGKLPKLKEPVLNGFLHDNGTRPNNVSRPAISSDQVSQNGNGPVSSQKNTTFFTKETHTVISNQKVNGKVSSAQSVIKNEWDMRPCQSMNNSVNGIFEGKYDISSWASSAFAENSTAEPFYSHAVSNGFSSHLIMDNGRKTARPNVHEKDNKDFRVDGTLEGKKDISHPDLKYLSQILTVPNVGPLQYDDDEWIFGSKGEKKLQMGPSEIECTKSVWAEAIRFEHADVTVLPYVVPY
ncbi:At5g48610-like protein [Striga asiatica]|uniref:At5g48610-like protein n=1 Tax=Striga asiatica TaxID=4170 RepID=A0A5A7PER1_STRAF|nr:At5g48610-like protein [Striga asiatica]